MGTRRLKSAKLVWAALIYAFAFAGPAGAQGTAAIEGNSPCEVHVWQSRSYIAGSPAPLAAYGLIGAILKSEHDAHYPADTIQGQMERELGNASLGVLLAALPWQLYLG
jgi:hypothetical protein